MSEVRETYNKLLASGMFWIIYPNFTGDWETDKAAFTKDYNGKHRPLASKPPKE